MCPDTPSGRAKNRRGYRMGITSFWLEMRRIARAHTHTASTPRFERARASLLANVINWTAQSFVLSSLSPVGQSNYTVWCTQLAVSGSDDVYFVWICAVLSLYSFLLPLADDDTNTERMHSVRVGEIALVEGHLVWSSQPMPFWCICFRAYSISLFSIW